MAAPSSNPRFVDPFKPGKYPVIVSERLLNDTNDPHDSLISVELNHVPGINGPIQKALITASQSDEDTCDLIISSKDGQGKYKYTGSQQATTSCVLIFQPETQSFLLDRLDSEFSFNLRSTPINSNAKALAAEHPQLDTTAPEPISDEEDLLAAEHALADPDNPYDYRHYLVRWQSSSPEPIDIGSRNPSRQASQEPSPQPIPRSEPKRKQSKSERKQRLQKHPPKPSDSQPPPEREEADADNEQSEEDDGGLQIIMEPSNKPRRRFNTKRDGGEPRSLRSAASSVSPQIRQQYSSEEASDDDDIRSPPPAISMESPVRAGYLPDMEVHEVEDEDDGDLEAELERELEKEADGEESGGVPVTRYLEESSSESEEE